MKTVRFHRHGGPEVLKVEEVESPQPKAREILVRVESIGVNFTDLSARKGATLRTPLPLPYTPGVEVAGTVHGLGEGATRFHLGQRVVALVPHGGYAEEVVIPESQVGEIPSGMEPERAVAVPLQGLTAYHILKTLGKLQPGETVLIQAAAGGVGSWAIQLAKLTGALVVAATGSGAKLARSRSLGADFGVNYDHPAWKEEVLQMTGGRGVDLFLDMRGGPRFSENFEVLAPFGRIVTFGAAGGERASVDPEKLTSRCHSVLGFYSGFIGRNPALVGPPLQELFSFVADGRLQVDVNHRFPLEDAAEAHRQMEARATTGKIVLTTGLCPLTEVPTDSL